MNFFDLREPVSAWTHIAGLVLALPGTLLLWRRGAGDRARQLSLLVYGLSLAFCYGASALFHGVWRDGDQLAAFQSLDHVGIFGLIAGSYTPIAWNLLRGRWRQWTLRLVWLAAVGGATLNLAYGTLPIWLSTGLYLGMGWGSLICYLEIARALSHRLLRPILVGGLLYSIGAALNLLDWPILWPGVFGAHELFHLFVLAGSLAHFRFMLRVVVPSAGSPMPIGPSPGPGPTSFLPPPHLFATLRGEGRRPPWTAPVLPGSDTPRRP